MILELLRDGRYELGSPLGRDEHEERFSAIDTTDGRAVEVRLLSASVLGGLPGRGRRYEAYFELAHPSIIRDLDIREAGSRVAIISEPARGVNLDEFLMDRGGRLTWDEATDLSGQLLDVLEHVHGKGLSHRDLRPSTVRVDDGVLRVARVADRQVIDDLVLGYCAGTVIGSPAYMPPEQIKAMPLDHKVDIYATGGLIYHMSTGLAPFVGGPIEVVQQVVKGQPPKPPSSIREDLPTAFDRWLARSMAPDARERWATAAVARSELLVCRGGDIRPG